MNNNYRISPFSRETNNLRQSGVNIQQNESDNISNENSLRGNTNNNNNNQNNNKADIKVCVKFNCCGTPYFQFGRTIFFYCPNSLKDKNISNKYYSTTVNASEMPDPIFSIGPECKLYIIIFYFYLRR